MAKDSIATIKPSDIVSIECGYVKMSLDNACFDFKYIDSDRLLDIKLDYHFQLESLDDLLFELTQKNCFIDSFYLDPLIENGSNVSMYDIFYTPQDNENSGIVKIVATVNKDGEDVLLYTSVLSGRQFKSQIKG